MHDIVNHPNYEGLPITIKKDGSYSWVATAKSEIGKERIRWCLAKAVELDIPNQPGVYADVMLRIHPTKWKVCQTCGRQMSLFYHYPNAHFLKGLNKVFGSDYTDCDHISYIWDDLLRRGVSKQTIAAYLIDKGALDLNARTASKEEVIDALEFACRKGGKACLGPGAMSNFPDRYDGFHTYNRCCRHIQDTGRSKENLKSYSKDRRAYEYWSDGNIHAANQFMGSSFFEGTSADHIGPISLGFVHDPRYLQPMPGGDNSAKRDRLQLVDIVHAIEVEDRTGICAMSWFSRMLWEYIKQNYAHNQRKIGTVYRDALKQNMSNFMYVLWHILKHCPENGESFLVTALLKPNFKYFNYSYEFNDRGEITARHPRHFTDRNANETERYCRIALESVYDYNEKENRNSVPDLTLLETRALERLCGRINRGVDIGVVIDDLRQIMITIQKRLIDTL
jgi:Alw26I/Eco31I/Esp3I family type II restriction endonuclease